MKNREMSDKIMMEHGKNTTTSNTIAKHQCQIQVLCDDCQVVYHFRNRHVCYTKRTHGYQFLVVSSDLTDTLIM